MDFPNISIITPTYNEAKIITAYFESIRKQDYPQKNIEILIIDDYSTDTTVEIAKKYKAKIFYSGEHHIERSKSIGIEHATSEFLLFIDADIQLVSPTWLKKCMQAFKENPHLVGTQAVYWNYHKSDSIYDRYCELLGVNDPFVYTLRKRGVLGPFEKKWIYPKTLMQETKNYFLVKYDVHNAPTLGSQGYITKKSLIKKHVVWKPYFFHLDAALDLINVDRNIFAMMKLEVKHKYTNSFLNFHKKLYRNITLFLEYKQYRKYTYANNSIKFMMTVLGMITVLYPTYQSIKGFLRKPDVAWFLHPIFSVTIPLLYAFVVLQEKMGFYENKK